MVVLGSGYLAPGVKLAEVLEAAGLTHEQVFGERELEQGPLPEADLIRA